MKTTFKGATIALAFTLFGTVGMATAEPIRESLNAYADSSADGDNAPRDVIWKDFSASERGADKEFLLYSESRGGQAGGSATNHILLDFEDNAAKGVIQVIGDLRYSNDAPKDQHPQPSGSIQYYTNWAMVYRAEVDGELVVTMDAEAFAHGEDQRIENYSPSAKFSLSGNGSSAAIEFQKGVFLGGVHEAVIPVQMGKIYVLSLTTGLGTSGGIRTQQRFGNFQVQWEFTSQGTSH